MSIYVGVALNNSELHNILYIYMKTGMVCPASGLCSLVTAVFSYVV